MLHVFVYIYFLFYSVNNFSLKLVSFMFILNIL